MWVQTGAVVVEDRHASVLCRRQSAPHRISQPWPLACHVLSRNLNVIERKLSLGKSATTGEQLSPVFDHERQQLPILIAGLRLGIPLALVPNCTTKTERHDRVNLVGELNTWVTVFLFVIPTFGDAESFSDDF